MDSCFNLLWLPQFRDFALYFIFWLKFQKNVDYVVYCLEYRESSGTHCIVQQPEAIYLANPVSSDKLFFSSDYISFGCI